MMNLEIKIGVTAWYRNGSSIHSLIRWLKKFLNAEFMLWGPKRMSEPIPRKSCKILFDSGEKFSNLFGDSLSGHIYWIVSCMNDFEVLAFAIPNNYSAKSESGIVTRSNEWLASLHSEIVEDGYERVQAAFQLTLGPAQIIRHGKGVHIEFHPYAHYLRELDKAQVRITFNSVKAFAVSEALDAVLSGFERHPEIWRLVGVYNP